MKFEPSPLFSSPFDTGVRVGVYVVAWL
jgi:hypothetical protein